LSQEEASFKLKEQKIIITKLIRTKKKAADKTKKKGSSFSLFKKKNKTRRCCDFFKAICNNGKSRSANS
jgi:type IV pilus assembly protein PilC